MGEKRFNHKEPSAAEPQPKKRRRIHHKGHKGHKGAVETAQEKSFGTIGRKACPEFNRRERKNPKKEFGFVAAGLKPAL